MTRLWLVFGLAALSACAKAGSGSTDAATDSSRPIDAMVDGNGCAVQPCSILPQCGCGGANACDIDLSDSMGTACRPVTSAGQETATCNGPDACDKGFVCLGGSSFASCKKYCSTDADCGSPRGLCVLDITNNGVALPGIPPACSSNCDPTSTSPAECPSTYKCGLFTATHNGQPVKIADCSPAGTGTQGTNCKVGTSGIDSMCGKGYMCTTVDGGTNYNCRRICNKSPGPSNCGAQTCIGFTTPHTINGVEYGVCN